MANFIKRKIKTLTLGEKLKKIREKSGISLAEISSKTKVKQEYLEKIEANDYGNLPFDVYVKGFLRSYSNYLDLNSKKVIAQFEKEVGIRENVKKYQHKPKRSWENKFPSLTITPKMASLFFSFVIALIGFSYFYIEVDHFSKEPSLIIESPASDQTTNLNSIEIIGKTDFENKITINNEPVYVDSEGKFKEKIGLQKGVNEIAIESSNKFNKNTKKIINVVADYDLEPFVAGTYTKENQQQNETEEQGFFIEIESREVSSWISYRADQESKQNSTLNPGSILKIKVDSKIELSSGKASNTYVKINDGEFFPVDEKIKGFKKINLDKDGIISGEQEEPQENNQ